MRSKPRTGQLTIQSQQVACILLFAQWSFQKPAGFSQNVPQEQLVCIDASAMSPRQHAAAPSRYVSSHVRHFQPGASSRCNHVEVPARLSNLWQMRYLQLCPMGHTPSLSVSRLSVCCFSCSNACLQQQLRSSDDECRSSKRLILQAEAQKLALQQQVEQLGQQLQAARDDNQELHGTIIEL